jgi:hypothetical protein
VPLGQAEGVPGALAVPDEPENLAVTGAGLTGYIRYMRKSAPDHDRQDWGVFVKDQLNYGRVWQASSIFST